MKIRKKCTSSSESSQISQPKFIPLEVCTQILGSLPVKTLVRFRCVCKSWCSVMDDPEFVYTHLKLCKINSEKNKSLLSLERLGHNGERGCLLTVRKSNTLEETSRIFRRSDVYGYHILGSCNGLLLVRRYGPPCYQKELRLWNPSIKKSLILSTCPFPTPLLDGSKYVFGFALNSKDYKVIGISYEGRHGIEPTELYVAVYTLSDQQWTVRDNGLNIGCQYFKHMFGIIGRNNAVFFEGAPHWLGNDPYGDSNHKNEFTHLVSLDFDMEEFTFSELSFASDEKGSLRFLFLLRGSLAIFSVSCVSSSIWVLEKGAWTIWFSGNSSLFVFDTFSSWSYSKRKVLYCESDGGCFIFGRKSYNIATCEVQQFIEAMSSYLELETYLESLVLCKGHGAKDLESFP